MAHEQQYIPDQFYTQPAMAPVVPGMDGQVGMGFGAPPQMAMTAGAEYVFMAPQPDVFNAMHTAPLQPPAFFHQNQMIMRPTMYPVPPQQQPAEIALAPHQWQGAPPAYPQHAPMGAPVHHQQAPHMMAQTHVPMQSPQMHGMPPQPMHSMHNQEWANVQHQQNQQQHHHQHQQQHQHQQHPQQNTNEDAPSEEPDEIIELSDTNIYLRGLASNTTDLDLKSMCTEFGEIVSAKAIVDHEFRNCKGYGFVKFLEEDAAQRAVESLVARGVQATYARVSRPKEQHRTSSTDPTNLYLSNLPKNMDERGLVALLKQFGDVVSCRVLREQNGASRGVALARLSSRYSCRLAIQSLHDRRLSGSFEPLVVKFADGPSSKKVRKRQAAQSRLLQASVLAQQCSTIVYRGGPLWVRNSALKEMAANMTPVPEIVGSQLELMHLSDMVEGPPLAYEETDTTPGTPVSGIMPPMSGSAVWSSSTA